MKATTKPTTKPPVNAKRAGERSPARFNENPPPEGPPTGECPRPKGNGRANARYSASALMASGISSPCSSK